MINLLYDFTISLRFQTELKLWFFFFFFWPSENKSLTMVLIIILMFGLISFSGEIQHIDKHVLYLIYV
jgi:hypothetical protein